MRGGPPSATMPAPPAGAACASEADDAADVVVDIPEGDTVAFLQEAGRRTSEGSYRMELRLSMSGEVDDDSTTVATGVVDGADSYMEMDFGAMFEEMAG